MARNLIVNGVTYNGVEALEMTDANGEKVLYSEGGGGGGGGGTQPSASTKAVNFRDYDGTPLYSYTAEEALALSELPPLPVREGLICQEWNWSLADMQEYVASYGVCEIGATYITDDGKTRIYITLTEGRTSPMLGCCPNGTVTVDWGDGTTPDILTGTSVTAVKWTPTHEYAKPGDYIITLTVDGGMGITYGSETSGILRYNSESDSRNSAYQCAVTKIEIGEGDIQLSGGAFYNCTAMKSITMPRNVSTIGSNVFRINYSLRGVVVPSGITALGTYSLYQCLGLRVVSLPASVVTLGTQMFYDDRSLQRVVLPNQIAAIPNAFTYCRGLACIHIPINVKSIAANAFADCMSMGRIKFAPTVPPVVANSNAFADIPADCVIEVPAESLEEYRNATNYSGIAAQMIGV